MSEAVLISLWFGVLGALIGSFLNVCISRLPYDESITLPRSHCPRCGAWIAWYQNIPILSFLLLGGRCRSCRMPISWRYVLVEATTALLFAAGGWRWGFSWHSAKWCILSAVMVELIVSDIETYILPDEFTLWGGALGVMLSPMAILPDGLLPLVFVGQSDTPLGSAVNSLGSALLLSGGFWALGSIYQRVRGREGLGFGDVKMAAAMGALLGLESAMMAVLAASVLGGVGGGLWILLKGKKAAEQELPFGAFLGATSLLVAWLA